MFALATGAYWFRFHSINIKNLISGHAWTLTLVALFYGALMLRTLVPETVLYRIFNLRWLRAIGTVSYGAYVFHYILHDDFERLVAHILHHGSQSQSITAVLVLAATLAIAFISYRYFESPIQYAWEIA